MRLSIENLSKQYGLDHALRRVSLELRAGSCHTVLGPPGAGKTTLAALLGGVCRADAGAIFLEGHPYTPRNLRDARAAGVSVLLQDSPLPTALTVEEALLLGFEPMRLGALDRVARTQAARRALAALRSDDIPLGLPLAELPPGQRRRVALARGLMGSPQVVVVDEPAGLSDYDYESLLIRLRDLLASGTSVLLLTRSIERAREFGGSVSILREGVLEPPLSALPPRFSLEPHRSGGSPRRGVRPRLGEVILAVHHLMSADLHAPVSLTVREGEILGLAGAPCSGRGALLRAIAGEEPVLTGAIHLRGRPITRCSPARRQRLGIESFHGESDAFFPDRCVSENLLLSRMGRAVPSPKLRSLGRCGFYAPEDAAMIARDWMEKLAIRPAHPDQPAGELSRANRRKVALARLFQSNARLLILNNPALHLDATSRAIVYGWLSEMAAEGRGLLLSGPQPEELLSFCDTIALLHRGRLKGVRPAAEWTLEELQPEPLGLSRTLTTS